MNLFKIKNINHIYQDEMFIDGGYSGGFYKNGYDRIKDEEDWSVTKKFTPKSIIFGDVSIKNEEELKHYNFFPETFAFSANFKKEGENIIYIDLHNEINILPSPNNNRFNLSFNNDLKNNIKLLISIYSIYSKINIKESYNFDEINEIIIFLIRDEIIKIKVSNLSSLIGDQKKHHSSVIFNIKSEFNFLINYFISIKMIKSNYRHLNKFKIMSDDKILNSFIQGNIHLTDIVVKLNNIDFVEDSYNKLTYEVTNYFYDLIEINFLKYDNVKQF